MAKLRLEKQPHRGAPETADKWTLVEASTPGRTVAFNLSAVEADEITLALSYFRKLQDSLKWLLEAHRNGDGEELMSAGFEAQQVLARLHLAELRAKDDRRG